ncbi:Subtilisin-like protein [Venustampulla echinocandica]|uniref:Subtilisin-like protein n=1 Tax=Venustampulla echinocandica TaxID=2656787 RepID=A0A370TF74_9HELO|nr:Subtilisin-like protein [Venustampulla echinocandica]RDL33329.1 Subtilisin-like protein [Venustampulla echinocandica]
MAPYLAKLAALAAVIAPLVFAAPASNLKVRNSDATNVVPDSYIVVYNDQVSAATAASHIDRVSSLISKRDTDGIGATYDMDLLKGYQITADEDTIQQIAASPEVAYIEKDGKVQAWDLLTESDAPYGLARVSHRTLGTSTSYVYDSSAGSGVTIYVVDTGIYIEHAEFGGRASFGANFISGSPNTDEYGHGTHCAGTAAGTTYGVAKNAKLVAVKVLDKNGSGSFSGVISGIQWVGNNAAPNSVLTMSLGGGQSSAVNSAVASTVRAGVTVVVAAGNSNADASGYSPASEPTAITVGATDSSDTRASFSNWGSLLDIFAPGVNILSSWIGGRTATNTISGTSMATPHIAGLAAYLISLEGLSGPNAVVARLQQLATSGRVTDAKSPKNLIGYNGSGL